MLLIILALFWVAILTPVVIRRFRDHGTERSIDSFHAEHEVLSRQDFVVAPAHRLDEVETPTSSGHSAMPRPRLTVVHPEDTYRSLENRSSWQEWSEDYDFDREISEQRPTSANRYASAYSAVPMTGGPQYQDESPVRHRSMRARRKVLFMRLMLSAVVLTVLYLVIGHSIVEDLAILAWVALVSYVGLALFAVSQGLLNESSLPIRLPRSRQLATIEPLYAEPDEDFSSEFYEPETDGQWRRESRSRYALG